MSASGSAGLEVESAGDAVDVHDFASEVEVGADERLEFFAGDFGERDSACSDELVSGSAGDEIDFSRAGEKVAEGFALFFGGGAGFLGGEDLSAVAELVDESSREKIS